MSKLEEVALAIKNSGAYTPDCQGGDEDLVVMARAAVEALREPTIEMFHAFQTTKTATHESLGTGFAWGNGWHAAIDAILYEPQTSSKPLPSSDPIITTVRYSTRTVENVTPPWPPSQGPEMTQQQVEAMERGRT